MKNITLHDIRPKAMLLAAVGCLMMSADLNAQTVTKTKTGIRVANPGRPTTEVTVMNDQIVRVTKYADGLNTLPEKKSYSVIMTPQKNAFTVLEKQDAVELTTANIRTSIDKATGTVHFFDREGKLLLDESPLAEVKAIGSGVDKGQYTVSQTWLLERDEAIFGFGQRREGQTMNQRGQTFRLWNTNTHIYIPYFASEKGYGLYWDNAGETFYADSPTGGTTLRSSVAQGIDYYFMYRDGTQDGVVAAIHQLSGQPTLFPLWSYGFWQCRERYKTPDELSGVLDEYRRRRIPLDTIVQDWQYWGCDSNWNAMAFQNPHYLNKIGDPEQMRYLPNDENPEREIEKFRQLGEPRLKTPQEMVDYVHRNHAHLMITIWPDFGPWTKQYADLGRIGALYPFETWPQKRGVKVYDPFNPKARDIYWQYLSGLYDMGMDAWWTDSTEPDHFERPGDSDFMTHDGSWRSVKNAFPLVTNRGIYEHQRRVKGNTKRSFQMTRSGAFGLQHYATFSWSGDIQSRWDEMKNQVPSGLNYVICGIPMWNTDLGGFFCWDYNNDPRNPWAQELNVRWLQWGTFMPLMRSHCSSPMVTEIYKYGEPGDWAYDVMVDAVRLRYRLMPYIYSLAGMSVQRSELIMRPFVMDFPKDKKALERDDAYMFGRNILVKPVTAPLYTWIDSDKHGYEIYPDIRKAAAPVEVYLPGGTLWYDFYTLQARQGGKTYNVPAPIDRIPAFVRAGSILPLGPDVQYTGEKPWDALDVVVYPGADGTFTLYEDEGDGYGYEKGQFTTIGFSWDEARQQLTIADRQGKYKGMLTERTFLVRKLNGKVQSVPYSGKAVSVKL